MASIKELILHHVKKSNKTIQDISTFSLVRPGNGLYYIKVYWSGKTKAGNTRAINIKLNYDAEMASKAVIIMDEIMEEAKTINIDYEQIVVHTDATEGW